MNAGDQSAMAGRCPSCGYSVDANAVYCPSCGRPYSAPIAAATPDNAYTTTPAQAAYATVPPPLPSWAEQPTSTGGIAGLASGAAITPEQPVRSHKRRTILTALSALVLVGLIASGAYWAYAAFISRSDTQLARYFPANSFAFASADLVAAGNNKFNINPANLTDDQKQALKNDSGLDWDNDIKSWVGQNLAVGVFPLAGAQQGQTITDPASAVGVVAVIQSRDDSAAKAAIGKVNDHLTQQGKTLHSSTYKNFTLYAPETASVTGSAGIYGSGSGWVIVASNDEAAHAVIDRLNGSGDTLSDQQAFKDAIGNLPSNHFGAYYINLRQVLNTVVPVRAPNGLASVSIPFIDSYPVAGGYVAWTDTGERSQITFTAVRNPNIPDVSGDTTGFASLAPSDASAYAGVANLGKLIQAFTSQFGTVATGVDPLKSAFGISATDPLAQQPAALSVVKSGDRTQPVFYVHVSDSASATQLVNKIATARNWTTQALTIAGQSATGLYYSAPIDGTPPPNDGTDTASARLAAVALTLHNTLVIAPDTNTATLIAQVSQGSVANLTSNANFSKMVKAAPSGAAATAYLDIKALDPSGATGSAATNAIFKQFDAIGITLIWNNSVLQGTFDTTIHP